MTEPSAEQLSVIEAPLAAKILVTANPGTGKTYTLTARAIWLGDRITDTVLALSFTRAVVSEIRRRGAQAGGTRVEAATIDSFAARLLGAAGEEPGATYDESIVRATRLVVDAPDRVMRIGHVLIDEVQDLVGPRLAFVDALLRHASGGFTAFGDPRQAIYGWQGGDDPFVVLRASHPDLVEASLATVRRPRVAELLASELGVEDLLLEAKVAGTLRQVRLLLRGGQAVILTRTNGEGLVLAQQLAELGTTATVRQGAAARMAPGWIARFANTAPRSFWGRRHVVDVLGGLDGAPTADEGWRVLRRVARKDDGVAANRLRLAVAQPAAHDDFAFSDDGVISTIHRAKGLEWDQVVVLEHDVDPDRPLGEEERILYVALTRARREVWRFKKPKIDGRVVTGHDERWERRTWAGAPLAMELRIGDIALEKPFTDDRWTASEQQQHLGALQAGARVLLRREGAGARYRVECDGRAVARTTKDFENAVLRRWRRSPDVLVGGRVLTVRAAAGDPDAGERAGLAPTGLWLSPEVVGLVGPESEEAV